MNRATRAYVANRGASHFMPERAGTESGVRSLSNDKSPGTTMRTIAMFLFAMLSAVSMIGCEIDSFFNPSVTGYYEHAPTSMPTTQPVLQQPTWPESCASSGYSASLQPPSE